MHIITSIHLKNSKRYFILTMALALFIGLLYSQSGVGGQMIPTIGKTTPAAISKVDTDKKVVALTFDVSWGEKVPGPVLDALQAKKVNKATFFLSGPWVTTHTDLVERIKNMGFEIGSHGQKFDNFTKYNDAWIEDQVKKSEDAIVNITGVKPTLIRTPNGDINKRVIEKLNSMNYQVIQWDTDSKDWLKPGVDKIVKNVLDHAHPGDIILLHASDASEQTPAALGKIIDGLRQKGYDFVTVSELINDAKVKSKVE